MRSRDEGKQAEPYAKEALEHARLMLGVSFADSQRHDLAMIQFAAWANEIPNWENRNAQ